MMKYKQTIIGILGILAIWQFVAWLGVLNPIYFASPYEVFLEIIKMFSGSSIYLDILNNRDGLTWQVEDWEETMEALSSLSASART